LESHLVNVHKLVEQFQPEVVLVDPITNLISVGTVEETSAMLIRLIDYLKNRQITACFTSLTAGGSNLEQSEVGISSLMDTWVLLRVMESQNERNRIIYILKSRGMGHSNQVREFLLTPQGIQLVDVYAGPGEVLTGSARLAQEARDRQAELEKARTAEDRQRELLRERLNLEAELNAVKARLDSVTSELRLNIDEEAARLSRADDDRRRISAFRKAD
jgi:circadian clock protein KaiC